MSEPIDGEDTDEMAATQAVEHRENAQILSGLGIVVGMTAVVGLCISVWLDDDGYGRDDASLYFWLGLLLIGFFTLAIGLAQQEKAEHGAKGVLSVVASLIINTVIYIFVIRPLVG